MKPIEWTNCRLGEIAEIVMGQSPSGDTCNNVGIGVPLLNGPTEFGSHSPSPMQYTSDPKKKSKKNDILFCVRGSTTGRMNWSDQEFAIGRGLAAIRSRKSLDLQYFIKGIIDLNLNQILGASTGSTFPNVSRDQLNNLEIFIPTSKDEQYRIASILSSLDNKIELNLQMNKSLEAIAQAIFKEWFVDFRFPGSDGELVGGLPRGWRMRKLNRIAEVEIGRTPPRMENQWFSIDNKDIKWISIRDMGNSGIFIFNTSEYLTLSAIEKFRIPVIPPNTVVLSFKLTIGRVGITTERMVSNEAIAQIKSETLDSGFIYCLLKNYHFDSLGSTSSIASAINSKIIKEMEVLVPEKNVVDEFCRIAGPILNKIKNNSLEIKTITEIRDSLLPKLMTGKIKVV